MAEDIVSIGIALDTSKVLAGARQVDTALKQVASTSATTAQATQKMDAAAKTAGQAMQAESQAAQAVGQSLRQQALAAQDAAQKTTGVKSAADAAAQAMGQNLATAVAAAAQSMIQAQREAKKAEDELRKVAQATAEAEKAAALASMTLGQKLAGAFRDVGQQAKAFGLAQVGVSGLQQAFSSFGAAVSSAVQAAIKMESLEASFKFVSGSAKAASADLGFLRQTAERLGVSFIDSTKGFQQMAASAQNTRVAGQGVRDIFTAIAEKGRVLGLSSQEIQGAMLAVSQSFSKGTIAAEELRGQFAERMPGAINEMARAMGVGAAELGKMMEKGELGIEGWVRWAQVVKQDLGGATQDAARTAGAALERFGNAMNDLKVAVGQYIVPALTATINLLTGVASAATKAMNALTSYDKVRKTSMEEAAAVASKGEPGAVSRYGELQQQAAHYEAQAKLLRTPIMSKEGAFSPGAIFKLGGETEAAQYEAKAKALREEAQGLLGTMKAIGDEDKRRQQASAMEKTTLEQRNTFLAGAKKLLAEGRKEAEASAAATKAGLGRDPTAEEKVRLQEKLTKDRQEFLQTNSKMAEQYKDDPAVKALREEGQAQEAASKALDDGKKSAQAASSAASKAAQEAEAAEKKKQQAREETARLDKQQADEVGRVHAQSIESLRQLNAKYTEAKTETDADRASKLAASLAYSQHTAEANKLAEAIGKATQALEDSRKTEAKVPKLREQAEVSAGAVSDITRLRGQLEPRRRDQTRGEQHARILEDLEKASKGDPDTMAWARKQSAATLAFEETATQLERLKDLGEQTFQTLGDALGEFVSKGKLDFKSLMDALTSDLLKFASQTIMGEATKKGGWLETILNVGLKAVGIAGGLAGGGMPTSGTLPTTEAAYTTMAAAGAFSGRQHGGPAYAGTPYMVGEAGPELFVPQSAGTVVPQGQFGGGSGPVVVHMHISTPNADSFQRSRGEIEASMVSAMQRAQRNA